MRVVSVVVAAAACAVGCVIPAFGQSAFHTYGAAYRPVTPPPVGAGSFFVAAGALADGRLLAVTGASVFVESGVGTGAFQRVADFEAGVLGPGMHTSDPSFLTVSPDGSTIALGAGTGRPVVVFSAAALGTAGSPTVLGAGNTRSFNVGHFDGRFATNTQLALTAGPFGSATFVTMLDVTSSVGSPVNPTVISNIAGASAGIGFDAQGRLFAANGFATGSGSPTGQIRAFDQAAWMAAAAGGAALNFETQGTLIGEVLSGGALTFDAFGNLFVGGGDFGAGFDAGYLGVLNASAIAAALGGGGPVNTLDPEVLRRLDPLGTGFGYFGATFNAFTGELIITGDALWYATVPAPSAAPLLAAAGLLAWRRRRA